MAAAAAASPPSLLDLDLPLLVRVAERLSWRELLQLESVRRAAARRSDRVRR